MVPKSTETSKQPEHGEFMKIGVSCRRQHDFRGLAASKIEEKTLKKQCKKQECKKRDGNLIIIDFWRISEPETVPKSIRNCFEKRSKKEVEKRRPFWLPKRVRCSPARKQPSEPGPRGGVGEG